MANIKRVVCVCWYVWGCRGQTTHTTVCFSTRYCFLALNSTTMRPKWWPRHHHHLSSTHSLPLLTPLAMSRSTMGGSAVLQDHFDPFHVRGPTSQLESLWKLSMWGYYQPNGQNHNSSHSEYPGSKRRAGFGSPVGKRSSSFTVVQPPRHTVWHPERHHMLKERRWAHQDRFMCMIWSEPLRQKHTFISVKSVEGWTTFRMLMSPINATHRVQFRSLKVTSFIFWACLGMFLPSKTGLRCSTLYHSQIKKPLLNFSTSQDWL